MDEMRNSSPDPFASANSGGVAPGAAPGSPPPLPPPAQSAPLHDGDYAQVRAATARFKTIQKAARTAKVSSIIGMVIGLLSLPFVLMSPSWDGALIVAGICAVAGVEYWGHTRMRRSDPRAAVLLGRNQLALLALITLYCVIQMLTITPEKMQDLVVSREFRDQMSGMPGLKSDVENIDRKAPLLIRGFYGLVILVSAICQGAMSVYYFTRRRHVEAFNNQTPPWVRRLVVEAQT